uniref:Ig-like domain-containing protein n=1 Tax=Xiphophorus couchianus TaxID=32473 RepID=A0A3B5LJM0_9TELE
MLCYLKNMQIIGHAKEPTATLTAGSTTIPVGGSVTLSCSVEPSAGWKYRWSRRTSDTSEFLLEKCPKPNPFFSLCLILCFCSHLINSYSDWEYKLNRNNKSYLSYIPHKSNTLLLLSGEYQCCGCRRSSDQTKCSNIVTVSGKPTATLTAGSTTIPVGGSVTLSCSVEPSAGWKYRWFRRTLDTPEAEITTNNEDNREITVTQGGIYKCAGERENPVFNSLLSHDVTIKTTCEFLLENFLWSVLETEIKCAISTKGFECSSEPDAPKRPVHNSSTCCQLPVSKTHFVQCPYSERIFLLIDFSCLCDELFA